MTRILVFELIQLAVSAFAIARGGAPERMAGWMLLIAAVASLGVGLPANGLHGISVPVFSIDLALFVGLFAIALRANRFWPYWAAALQLVAIGVHGARAFDPFMVPIVYSRVVGQIAYPMCVVLALGTYHYLRRRRREGAPPRPWAELRW